MKIVELDIDGFRSLKNVRWNPGDLNVLIGPNGAGKSNLLRVLELMAIAAQGSLGRHILSSGGMGSIVWDGRSPEVRVRVHATRPPEHAALYASDLAYDILLVRLGQSAGYVIDRELLGNFPREGNPLSDSPLALLQRAPSHNAVLYDERQKAIADLPRGLLKDEETVLSKLTEVSPTARLTTPYRQYFSEFSIYHDIQVQRASLVRGAVVSRAETRVDVDGQNLVNVLHTLYESNEQFVEDVDSAMLAAFGTEFHKLVFPPAADQRIQLGLRWRSLNRTQAAADLSDGTLRFLFLITVLANPSPSPLIAIDEPETGLHPSMFPIVAEYAAQAAERTQVIFTTHSPQFLDAFRDVVPTTTVATCEHGETKLTTLSGDDLQNWLKSFSLGTLFADGDLEAMA